MILNIFARKKAEIRIQWFYSNIGSFVMRRLNFAFEQFCFVICRFGPNFGFLLFIQTAQSLATKRKVLI